MLLANPDYAKYKAGGDEYTLLDSWKYRQFAFNYTITVDDSLRPVTGRLF